ncbi:MAG: hypothetical protein OXC55_04465 [Chloroflexi bacterium]|nr:hypothetical protein [Chloroflexota bacterium]
MTFPVSGLEPLGRKSTLLFFFLLPLARCAFLLFLLLSFACYSSFFRLTLLLFPLLPLACFPFFFRLCFSVGYDLLYSLHQPFTFGRR